jgi:hypothetical protein
MPYPVQRAAHNSANLVSMYVDASDLRPLDVILSRQRSKPSKLIAHAVSGIYAHAAIVVSSVELFDATPSGVALRPFKMDFDRDPHSWYEGEVLEVLRHSLLSELSGKRCEQLAAELGVVCRQLSGKRYASFASLVDLARKPWVLRLRQSFPNATKTAATILERILDITTFLHSSKYERQWSMYEAFIPTNDKGQRFYCSEAVQFVLKQIGLLVAINPVTAAAPLPHELADETRFFLTSRSVAVHEGRPGKRAWPKRGKPGDREVYKSMLAARKAGKKAMRAWSHGSRGPFWPDSERINAVMSSFSQMQIGPETKHLWSADRHLDAQMRRIAALRSLHSNLSDLVQNGRQSSQLVHLWGAAARSHVSAQIEELGVGTTLGFVEYLSKVAPRVKPVEDLLNKIREQELLISDLLANCRMLCRSLV